MSIGLLIFVQVCRTIDKNLSVFISSIGSGRTNESSGIYKRSLCCKKRASEDHQKLKIGSFRVVKCCYSYAYDC